MVNVLWERGDVAASMSLENLFDQLVYQEDIAIFCSFLMDNFDGEVHARILPRLGENHSHLIPVEDYVRLENAVADALRETVGSDEARVLEARLLKNYPHALPNAARSGAPIGIRKGPAGNSGNRAEQDSYSVFRLECVKPMTKLSPAKVSD
jgi:hypothetical protein